MKRNALFLTMLLLSIFSSAQLFSQMNQARPEKWAVKIDVCSLNNLYQLNDSIYRSEQPGNVEFVCLGKLGIKSVLNLRYHHTDTILMEETSIQPYTVEMMAKRFTDTEIIASLRILKNSAKPILVHCLHGSDRTGVVIALYRIVFENWTQEQALDELKNGGYGFHEMYTNITGYIKNVNIEMIKNKVFKDNLP